MNLPRKSRDVLGLGARAAPPGRKVSLRKSAQLSQGKPPKRAGKKRNKMAQDDPEIFHKRVETALNAELPTFYFNGFTNSLTAGDVVIVLERNNKPIAILNTSYTVAKTLSSKLGSIIANLEVATGRQMLTTDDINLSLRELPKKSN